MVRPYAPRNLVKQENSKNAGTIEGVSWGYNYPCSAKATTVLKCAPFTP